MPGDGAAPADLEVPVGAFGAGLTAHLDRRPMEDRTRVGTEPAFLRTNGFRDLPYPLGVIWWKR